jgi:hypothetical protein
MATPILTFGSAWAGVLPMAIANMAAGTKAFANFMSFISVLLGVLQGDGALVFN